MLQIKVFGASPPCANCKRAEREALKAAENFPGQVEVVHLDALGPEAQAYGLMVTPVKDGMNLIAKEYCAASVDDDGILILSEFAGAAWQMRDSALIVNPYETGSIVNALHSAYHMPAEERRSRMHRLRYSVKERDIHWWSNLFLRSAKRLI